MIYTALNDFYLTSDQLDASPSREDDVSPNLESQLRCYGCDIIAEATILLGLPQVVACTAQVLLHRFYCKRSLTKFDVKVMAIAMFWLAAKLEEVIEIDQPSTLRLRHVIITFYRVIRRRENKSLDLLDPGSRRYDELKAEVVRGERHALRAFGFIVHVEHPHRFVLTFGQLLGISSAVVLQHAWNIANDSMRSPLCVRYKAEVIACTALFIATRQRGVPMPENPPWWMVFGVSEEELHQVTLQMMQLYGRRERAEYVALGKDYTLLGGDRDAVVPGLAELTGIHETGSGDGKEGDRAEKEVHTQLNDNIILEKEKREPTAPVDNEHGAMHSNSTVREIHILVPFSSFLSFCLTVLGVG